MASRHGPLRIAVDARPLAHPDTGIGRYTASLLGELARNDGGHQFLLYADRPVALRFDLPQTWALRHGSASGRMLGTPMAQSVFPLWAHRDRAELFWSPRHHLPLLLSHRIRKVVTIHDVVWKRFPETMNRGGRRLESLLMPAALRSADRVIAVSHFIKQELGELCGVASGIVDVIHEASSLPPVHRNEASALATPYFLFVGSCEPRKNLARMMKAYVAYLRKVALAADLVLVSSHSWGDFDIDAFIAANDLQQRVRVRRSVSDESLSGIYRGAFALLMPSLYEGFGLPLVEAMQWGVPIVTSSTSAMPEIVGDAALLVDPVDEHSISDALCRLSTEPELRSRLAELSRRRGLQFNWKAAAASTLATFERCATG